MEDRFVVFIGRRLLPVLLFGLPLHLFGTDFSLDLLQARERWVAFLQALIFGSKCQE
jgi:hypothetical protein